ncbi:MAG: Trk system potassium transporter TrkA [Spirochaetaceae bacterium]|nr:Trk system potassium transporter TrkA [Spirochaetaceae bacterium]
MNIIILGAGKVGYHLARQLILEDKHVTIIERDSHRAKQISNQLDCIVINDQGNNLEVLKQAGLDKADYFISVTEFDELNMIACGLASSNSDHIFTIARVRNIDYSSSIMSSRSLMGINQIINPEIEAAKEIAKSVEHGAMSNILQFNNADLQMLNLPVPRNSSLIGKTLLQINQEIDATFLVPVLMRDGDYLIPDGKTLFEENDLVYIIAAEKGFETIFQFFDKPKIAINKVAIVGCGHLGCYVADFLDSFSGEVSGRLSKLFSRFIKNTSKKLHLIDSDYEQCKYLSDRFPQAQVTHADITNEEIWEEEILKDYDLVVTSTGNQELNLITSMYAKKVGVRRSISLVQTRAYKHIAESLGIDVSISINNVLVSTILKVIRKGNIKSIHNISGSPFEIIEFELSQTSSLSYQQIKSIRLPKETLIIHVSRGDLNIIPHGALALEPNDHVVLITRKDAIKRLESIFEVI